MAHDVFISYASSDKAVADAVCSQLESTHRIRCWIAPRDVTPGASWAESIIDALDGSKIMVLIFSSKANASMQIEREVERAVHKGINIIPLRIENTVPTKTLEYFISAPHWLDALTVPLEQHINTLAVSVKALLAKQGATVPAIPDAPIPAPVSAPASPTKLRPAQSSTPPGASVRFGVPVLILLLVLAGVVAALYRRSPSTETSPTSTPPSTSSAAAASPAASAPSFTAAPISTPSPGASPATGSTPALTTVAPAPPSANTASPSASTVAPGSNVAAASTTATPSAGGTSASGTAGRTAGSPAVGSASRSSSAVRGTAAAAVPNLVLEFNQNLAPGSALVEIDGQVKLQHPLVDKATTSTLNLPTGTHAVTVKLLGAKGELRDTEVRQVSSDPGIVRTMKVQLSRFRRNLELEMSVRPASKPEEPTAKPSGNKP
jgi:hypothetical protein